jgi:hypothetical protein
MWWDVSGWVEWIGERKERVSGGLWMRLMMTPSLEEEVLDGDVLIVKRMKSRHRLDVERMKSRHRLDDGSDLIVKRMNSRSQLDVEGK